MNSKWIIVLSFLAGLAPLQARAADVRQTVRAAIVADDQFPSSLYTAEFVIAHKRAQAKDGLAAEGGLTGEAGTGRIVVRSVHVVGSRVLADIYSPRDGAAPLRKTITFFIASDGKIADVDTNTRGKLTGKGPMQQMPTLLRRYRDVLGESSSSTDLDTSRFTVAERRAKAMKTLSPPEALDAPAPSPVAQVPPSSGSDKLARLLDRTKPEKPLSKVEALLDRLKPEPEKPEPPSPKAPARIAQVEAKPRGDFDSNAVVAPDGRSLAAVAERREKVLQWSAPPRQSIETPPAGGATKPQESSEAANRARITAMFSHEAPTRKASTSRSFAAVDTSKPNSAPSLSFSGISADKPKVKTRDDIILDDLIASELRRCWSFKTNIATKKYVPEFVVELNLDGTFFSTPRLLNRPSESEDGPARLAASALSALMKCEPLTLPKTLMAGYRTPYKRVIRFDPEE